MSFEAGFIKKDHNSGFKKYKSKIITLYIAEKDGLKLGVCRFDLIKKLFKFQLI